jgi:RNA polymerase sigma-70 factor (ECF subfamily)
MDEPCLEALFGRYRSRGDLAALGQVFDRTAPELLRLAAHLVRDPVEAEDLVQTTFLAAIEGAGSFDASRRLEPWLAGILARSAARLRRERGRRPDPGRLVRAEPSDPAHALEQGELAGALARGLARLSAPYREVLELHLVHGQGPLEIARASRRAPGTVRMQILRGLERLRRALPAGLHGALPGVRAPRGIAALKAELLVRAQSAGSAAAVPIVSTTSILGVLVSSKTLAAAGVAALLALAALWTFDRSPAQPSERTASAPAAQPGSPAVGPEAAAEPPPSAPAREGQLPGPGESPLHAPSESRPAPQAYPGLWLAGRLLGLEGLDPAETRIVAATLTGQQVETTGRPEGSFELDCTRLCGPLGAPATLYVTALHPAQRRSQVPVPLSDAIRRAALEERTEVTLDLDLSPRTAIIGRVEAGGTVEPGEILVALAAEVEGRAEVSEEVNCDDEGRFRFFPRTGGEFTLLVHARGLPPLALSVHAPERVVTDVGTLELRPGGAAIEGTLVLPFEARPERYQVRALRREASDDYQRWEGIGLVGATIRTDEQVGDVERDGRFLIAGLEPGVHVLQLEAQAPSEIVLPFPALEVPAPASGLLFGQSYGLVKVVTAAERRVHGELQLQFALDGGYYARSAQAGERLEVIVDRRMPLSVQALAPGCPPASGELAAPRAAQAELVIALDPDPGRTTLLVEWPPLADGTGPAAVRAWLRGGGRELWYHGRASGDACAFSDLPPGRFQVLLVPGDTVWSFFASSLCSEPIEVELAPGETTRVRIEWQLGGKARFLPRGTAVGDVRARVLDLAERELSVRFVTRSFHEGVLASGSTSGRIPTGEPSELEPSLRPGTYVLVLGEPGAPELRVPFELRAGEVSDVPFDRP